MEPTLQMLDQAQYHALHQGVALQPLPESGVLTLGDADRSDFLHRMTTNNINALTAGNAVVTVLTNPTARILFTFTVICGDDNLMLLPATGQTAALEHYLRGQIFFMDAVVVQNVSEQYVRMRLMGNQAKTVLSQLGYTQPDSSDGEWHENNGVVALTQMTYGVPGVELVVPADQEDSVQQLLLDAGALLLTDEFALAARRIELGRPTPGAELTEEYNPLEAGLGWACADNKGCYTGQEIIARQVTYDKVTKTLVGLRSSDLLEQGAAVSVDGRNVGAVTSTAYSPTMDGPIALAIIKRPHNEPGSRIVAGDTDAEVAVLPFLAG